MRYYQHHIGDFNNATRHLTRIERSIYRDLIEFYYDIEKQLPIDISEICRKIIAVDESTTVERMLNEFFTKTPDGWYHDRCELEIEKYLLSNNQKSAAGRASAEKRALKKQRAMNGRETTVEIPLNGRATEGQLTINHKPLTINHEPNNKVDDFFNGVSSSVVSNFKKLRKELKAPITDLSIKAIKREADKAGISFEEALILMCENSWRGFKAEWIKKKNNGQFSSLGRAGQVTAMNGLKWLEETNGDS